MTSVGVVSIFMVVGISQSEIRLRSMEEVIKYVESVGDPRLPHNIYLEKFAFFIQRLARPPRKGFQG